MNYTAFLKELSRNKFRPAYMFIGKEDFLAESAINSLVDALVKPEEQTFNYTVYYGHEADTLPDTLFTPPIFGPMRVTVVRQAQGLSEGHLKTIVKYLKSPPKDGCLILWAGEIDKRKKFSKMLSELIDPVNCNKLRERDLVSWMSQYASKFNKSFDEEAKGHLSAINWPSLRELASELDQLVLLTGEEPEIKLKDVVEMGGGSFAYERWTLSDAIGSGDARLAHSAVLRLELLTPKITPTQIIGDLFRLYRQMWILKWFANKNQINQAKQVLGLPTFVFNKYLQYVNHFKIKGIEDGILRLLEADLNIKRGIRNGGQELSILVSSLLSKR